MHRRHYGPDDDPLVLVAQGASRDFNPSLPQSVVDRAMQRDPASASAEYLAQFRSDVDSFVSRESVEACVEVGCRERAPLVGVTYRAFAVVWDSTDADADSAARVRVSLSPRQMVHIDSVENKSLNLQCGDHAETLAIVDTSERIAFGATK